jgi:hypothetical protein
VQAARRVGACLSRSLHVSGRIFRGATKQSSEYTHERGKVVSVSEVLHQFILFASKAGFAAAEDSSLCQVCRVPVLQNSSPSAPLHHLCTALTQKSSSCSRYGELRIYGFVESRRPKSQVHLISHCIGPALHVFIDCLTTDPLCVSQVPGDARRPPERGPGNLLLDVRVVSASNLSPAAPLSWARHCRSHMLHSMVE